MKFDAVVGNPPYQQMDGGSKSSASPVYQYFIQAAKSLCPSYVSMITPAKWYSGGKGLDEFRDVMLNDERIAIMVDYPNSLDCFPSVDIAGGVSYFLWDVTHSGLCRLIHGTKGSSEWRCLNEFEVLIRHKVANDLVKRILDTKCEMMDSSVTPRKPFGLATSVTPMKSGDIQLRYTGGLGPYASTKVLSGKEMIGKWKVMISYLSAEHAGQPDKNGQYRVLSTSEILPPNVVCTETYLIAGCFGTKVLAKNLLGYLKTRFVRFLIGQVAVTQHITRDCFRFVPLQDFSEPWDDEKLYEKYGITPEEQKFIESMIKPMD